MVAFTSTSQEISVGTSVRRSKQLSVQIPSTSHDLHDGGASSNQVQTYGVHPYSQEHLQMSTVVGRIADGRGDAASLLALCPISRHFVIDDLLLVESSLSARISQPHVQTVTVGEHAKVYPMQGKLQGK